MHPHIHTDIHTDIHTNGTNCTNRTAPPSLPIHR